MNVDLSPDGRFIAACESSEDPEVMIWDAKTGERIQTLRGHTDHQMEALAWAPDSRVLVTGAWDDTVRVWDVDSEKQLQVLEGHTDDVMAVGVSHDARIIASKAEDHTVRIWRCDHWSQVLSIKETCKI